MMSLRARIFIIVSIVVLFILGISIFLVVGSKNKKDQTQNPPTGSVANNNGAQNGGQIDVVGSQAPVGLPAKIPTTLEVQKNGVVQLAKVFVERYGTYSTDNNFQNIKDVEDLVTDSLWSAISAPISAKNMNQNFVGVTTKVISADLTSWSDTKATVEIKTTRVEEKNGAMSSRYQNATVEMIKVSSGWLVDKMMWK